MMPPDFQINAVRADVVKRDTERAEQAEARAVKP